MRNHFECTKVLGEAQDTDFDNREMVREADLFLNKRDGQWEPQIISKFKNKPRYTLDECNPIVDDIMGEMEESEFSIKVIPFGGEASMKLALAYEGILRGIEVMSNASDIYMHAARLMVGCGMNAWRVVTDYRDDNSWQQDLLIQSIPNAVDSVWFDPGATKRTMEDSDECWVLSSLTKYDYDREFPDGSGESVGYNARYQSYSYRKPSEVIIGEYLYRKEKEREIARMSDGSVYVIDDKFHSMRPNFVANKVSVEATRKRKYHVVYQKLFDGRDWLTDEAKTVFQWIPVIPTFGNFTISENKVIYWGIVEKLMDPQRIINYAESRKIEEGALAPRGKYWMTKDQAMSPDVELSLRTLNTNADPVQFYDWAEGQPAPVFQGSPQSNPGLVETSASAQNYIQRTSGTFDEARGTAPSHRSGKAIGLLQTKSDNPKRKWFKAMEIPIAHTNRIIMDAIPKIYDTRQEMVMIGEDYSTVDSITIHDRIMNLSTGQFEEINDLSKGVYTAKVSSGPAFHSRQQETVNTIHELGSVDPTLVHLGGDVLLSNVSAPGIDKLAERKRLQLVKEGLIPEKQLTDEEKKMLAAQPKQPDAMMVAAQAEMEKAKAEQMKAQLKATEAEIKATQQQAKIELESMKLSIKAQETNQQQTIEALQAVTNQIKTQAETLKIIGETLGADSIITPEILSAFRQQAIELRQSVTEQ
jgi:hypothetical protein